MPSAVARTLDRALEALVPHLAVVAARADDGVVPVWSDARGWTSFLLSLSDDDLARCETAGLAALASTLPGAPPSLAALAAAAADLAVTLPRLDVALPALPPPWLRSVPARKRLQLAALLAAVAPLAARAARIVDVGAGSGHFTRIAADLFATDALGLELRADRVAFAAARAAASASASVSVSVSAPASAPAPAPVPAPRASFLTFDACREPLVFRPDDLAVGLHACGDVGDRLIVAAARDGCPVALVSCCLQKIAAPVREPLSRAARAAGLALPKRALGLTNLTVAPEGVEVPLAASLEARAARLALRRLLRSRGVEVAAGDEMRGINRRRARAGLRPLADVALALRALAPATDAELAAVQAEARADFARARRLTLPRALLARVTEVALTFDRAAALEDAGHRVEVVALCDPAVTPRNLAILGRGAG